MRKASEQMGIGATSICFNHVVGMDDEAQQAVLLED